MQSVVERDAASHKRKARKVRDAFLNQTLTAAGRSILDNEADCTARSRKSSNSQRSMPIIRFFTNRPESAVQNDDMIQIGIARMSPAFFMRKVLTRFW